MTRRPSLRADLERLKIERPRQRHVAFRAEILLHDQGIRRDSWEPWILCLREDDVGFDRPHPPRWQIVDELEIVQRSEDPPAEVRDSGLMESPEKEDPRITEELGEPRRDEYEF